MVVYIGDAWQIRFNRPRAAAIQPYVDTIWYDTLYLRAPKSWRTASLICRTEPNKKRAMKKLKTKNWDAQKKRCSH